MIESKIEVLGLEAERLATLQLPVTLKTQIDTILINSVFIRANLDDRQPYAVSKEAGKQHSAEGWGTGRAMARVPRVKGSGTSRAGEGAFANFCRKGRMAHPTKVTRRWQRKSNLTERLHAICSGLASTTISSLVQSRGHLVDQVRSLPIVITDRIHELKKTKDALELLQKIGLNEEVERIKESKNFRAGMGKMRNRKYRQRRGILIIHDQDDICAFRNLPGVEFMKITELDLKKICPGGTVGRLCMWTESAFAKLDKSIDEIKEKQGKKYVRMAGYLGNKQRNVMDIFYTQEVQAILEPKKYNEDTNFRSPKDILKNNGDSLDLFKSGSISTK